MTHSWGDFDTDPADQRAKGNIVRLNRLIDNLKYQQLLNASLADTFQERIDKLELERDAQLNQLRVCSCGLEKRDHLPNGKCPFASTTFKENI